MGWTERLARVMARSRLGDRTSRPGTPAMSAPTGASGVTRRRFLEVLGLGSTALLLRDFLPGLHTRASAEASDPLYLICATFDGGWDQLLALDPRDHTVYGSRDAGIYTAYDLIAASDPTVDQLLKADPSGLVRPEGSNIAFGPAVGRLADGDLFQQLCVIRGINMGTLTHEVGRRYFLTGKFPRGLQASGSALATVIVDASGDLTTIPNLVIGTETYNEGLDYFASGLIVQSSQDLQRVLTPQGAALPAEVQAAIGAWLEPAAPRCGDQLLDGNGQVSQYLASRAKALQMVEEQLGALFAFSATPTDPAMQALNAAFHISSNASQASQQLAGPAGEAMIAAQALTCGSSQAVSIRLATNIDHHDDDYLEEHSIALRTGFDALADLISYLRAVVHPVTGKAFWDHCVLLCTSDFARTPALNGRDGRDHHLASSCVIAGPGIKGNQVIGATDNEAMATQGIDLETGAVVGANGWTVRPPDVHATLLKSMGLPYEHLENQGPMVISAALK